MLVEDWIAIGATFLNVRLKAYEAPPRPVQREGTGKWVQQAVDADTHDGVWARILAQFPRLAIRPMITSVSRTALRQLQSRAHASPHPGPPDDLSLYFALDLRGSADYEPLRARLIADSRVVATDVLLSTFREPQVDPGDDEHVGRQDHLRDPPIGIGATRAWKFQGGAGTGVRFADVERGWTRDHEDLAAHRIPEPLNTRVNKNSFDHGTNVLGVVAAVDNDRGCVGIAPRPREIWCSSWEGTTPASAILATAEKLEAGDVVLIEIEDTYGGKGGPVEWRGAAYSAIRELTDKGIVVVAAAGNGDEKSSGLDLDALVHPHGQGHDSGSILVGAAECIRRREGRIEWAPVPYTTYGTRVNCFAQGEAVFTLGSDVNGNTVRYEDRFNATSAASAIVAGAAVSLQGIAKARLNRSLDPRGMRTLLGSREWGVHQSGRDPRAVGVMPNLPATIRQLLREVGA